MQTTLESLQRDIQVCSAEQERLRQRKAQLHGQAKVLLVRALRHYESLFGSLDEGPLADRELTMPDERHILDYWHADGDDLVFEFSYGFRGEVCNYEVVMPARYLGMEGSACMQHDAEILRVQKEREDAARRDAQDQQDRALYASLKARFETEGGVL